MSLIKQLIITSRPVGWFLFGGTFLLGFLASEAEFNLLSVFLLILMTFPASLMVFGVNDISDYNSDKVNSRRKDKLSGGVLNKKYHSIIFKISIFIGFLIFFTSLVTFNLESILYTVVILFVAFGYSLKPLKLKSRPPLELFANLFGAWSLVLLGYSFGGSFFEFIKIVGISNFISISLLILSIALQSYLADFDSDLEAKDNTTVHFLGRQFSNILIVLFYLIASSLITFNFFKIIFSLVALLSLWPIFSKKNYQNVYYKNIIFLISSFLFFGVTKFLLS